MNSKGLEMAISTLIVIVIGLMLLIGLVLFVTGGFERFKKTTNPLIESSEGSAIKEACNLACATEDMLTYCCKDFEANDETLRCDDSRLGVSCELSCAAVSCESAS